MVGCSEEPLFSTLVQRQHNELEALLCSGDTSQ